MGEENSDMSAGYRGVSGNFSVTVSVVVPVDIATALEHARSTDNGVLTTIRRDGRPQLSNISHSIGFDGVIRISITAARRRSARHHRRRTGSAVHGDSWRRTSALAGVPPGNGG
jgi:hypothetical protein